MKVDRLLPWRAIALAKAAEADARPVNALGQRVPPYSAFLL